MPGIARQIELFNQAFRLAWPYLSPDEAQKPNVSRQLSEAIRRSLKHGATDPAQIAADVVVEIRGRA